MIIAITDCSEDTLLILGQYEAVARKKNENIRIVLSLTLQFTMGLTDKVN